MAAMRADEINEEAANMWVRRIFAAINRARIASRLHRNDVIRRIAQVTLHLRSRGPCSERPMFATSS